jgi:hypothetical protein
MLLGQPYLVLHTSQPGSLTLVFSLFLSLIISLIPSEDTGSVVLGAVDYGVNLCIIMQEDRVDGEVVWIVAGTRGGRLDEGMGVARYKGWRRVLSRGSVHDWRIDEGWR